MCSASQLNWCCLLRKKRPPRFTKYDALKECLFFLSSLSHYLVCLLKVCLFPFLADIYLAITCKGKWTQKAQLNWCSIFIFLLLKALEALHVVSICCDMQETQQHFSLNRAFCKQFSLQQLAALRMLPRRDAAASCHHCTHHVYC